MFGDSLELRFSLRIFSDRPDRLIPVDLSATFQKIISESRRNPHLFEEPFGIPAYMGRRADVLPAGARWICHRVFSKSPPNSQAIKNATSPSHLPPRRVFGEFLDSRGFFDISAALGEEGRLTDRAAPVDLDSRSLEIVS